MKKKHSIKYLFGLVTLLPMITGILLIEHQGQYEDYSKHLSITQTEYEALMWVKLFTVVFMLAFFVMGYQIARKFYAKQKYLIQLGLTVLLSLLYGLIIALLYILTDVRFGPGFFTDQVTPTTNPALIAALHSIMGLFTLLGSVCIYRFENLKFDKDTASLGSFGTSFWVTLSISLVVLILFSDTLTGISSINFLSLYFRSLIVPVVYAPLIFLFLTSFFNNKGPTTGKFFYRLFHFLIPVFGYYALLYLYFSLALGFDSSIFIELTNTRGSTIFELLLTPALLLFITLVIWFFYRKSIAARFKALENESELNFLKSQINPHFLFNSLNSIYGTAIEEQSPKTAEGVQKLSEMMRFMLKENTEDKISLAKEINYINNYIDLQRLRVDENENIRIEVAIDEACQAEITPMLLIPFIENAFKHGISLNDSSWIRIELTCTSETVSLEVENSIHKLAFNKKDESGIGLENVKERLKLLYPEKHELEINSAEKQYFVRLKLTLA